MKSWVVVTENGDHGVAGHFGGQGLALAQLDMLEPAPGLVIVALGLGEQGMLALCRSIRMRPEPRCYLAPIVAVDRYLPQRPELASTVDLLLESPLSSAATQAEIERVAAPILHAIDELPEVGRDANVGAKVLRYLWTRNLELVPQPSSGNVRGYVYPPVEPFFDRSDESAFQVLDFLEAEHLVRGEFVDHVHLCHFCGSAFLNFVETCPQCEGKDLERDDLVHHFPCGYMGNSREFGGDGRDKICPKCGERLRGLGTDYDKPSLVYSCRSCRHVFQEPEIATLCYNCRRPGRPEDLVERDVKRYALTALGEHSAVHGLDALFHRLLDERLHLVDMETFKLFLQVEAARIRRYKISTSTVALLEIPGLQHLYARFGSRAREVFGEFASILKGVLRMTDIVASLSDTAFLILLVETPSEGAEVAMRRLREEAGRVFADEAEVAATLRTKIVPVDPEADPESCIEALLA